MTERLRTREAADACDRPGVRDHGAPTIEAHGGVNGQLALRAALTACTILISGETGCGKGHLARWIHEQSPRKNGPFVPVNCGAIPDSIIDSHLFGHARGSFTGATHDHPGMVRAASGGTLLLDEVSQLPHSAQVRLLRLLQEREAHPVGYSRPVVVDVRVIAATNVDLRDTVGSGQFREDLLYRLEIVRLHVKPLRERLGELEGLIDRFNQEFASLHSRQPLQFTAESMNILRRCRWPGNVRQVRALVERLHVLCPTSIITPEKLATFGDLHRMETSGRACDVSLDRLRRNHLQQLLTESDGSISRVAASLGVHRSTLYRWLRHPE
jgi:transcriptional regulator with PAS, ATPase and Fis domain